MLEIKNNGIVTIRNYKLDPQYEVKPTLYGHGIANLSFNVVINMKVKASQARKRCMKNIEERASLAIREKKIRDKFK